MRYEDEQLRHHVQVGYDKQHALRLHKIPGGLLRHKKEEQRRKVQRHPSLLLSDLSTNLLASAACPQPGTAAGASPLLFPERRLPVGSVRLLLLGREGDQDLCLLPAREREEVPWLLPRRVREVRRIRLRGWQRL